VDPTGDRQSPDELADIYAARFELNEDARRVLWQTLVDGYFQQFIAPSDTVLDLGAGYCDFINAVSCRRKIAVDLNPAAKVKADEDVEVHLAWSTDLPETLTNSVDVVWVSNFFEHLRDKRELLATLGEVHRVLRPGGRLLVVQPNIRLTKSAYWDFIDHTLPLTDRSLVEALRLANFRITKTKVRFLPYSAWRFPIVPALVRLYLRVPPAHLLFGKQTFVVARKR
jgi:SAM-dependent methyltransferase